MSITAGTVNAPPTGTNPQIVAENVNFNGATGEVQAVFLLDPDSNSLRPAQITANGLKVDASAATVPISAISLPLPAGAAADGTDATGVTQLSGGAGIRGWLSGMFSKLSTIAASLAGTLKVDGSAVTQPISAASLPLPAGAATDGTDATGVTQMAGGAGPRGWLSGNFSKLSTIATLLAGNLNVILQAGSNTIGSIASLVNPLPAGTNNIGLVTLAPCSYMPAITDTNVHSKVAKAFLGLQNLSGSAQPNGTTISIYDGVDATGTLIAGPITLGAEQIIMWPMGGIKLTSGNLAAVCAVGPSGNGIQVLYV